MTAYSKYTWTRGDVVTAAKLNNIETGIDEALNNSTGGAGLTAEQEATLNTVATNYVSKAVTTTGTNAQTQYNLVTNKITTGNITSTIWNESSGGGFQVKNTNANIISFIGVNNGQGDSDIWAQFYAKYINNDAEKGQVQNSGTRVNFTEHGVYYTVGKTSGAYTADDEIVTKATTSALEARIAALEAKVAELEDNSGVVE